ncbi:MAG: DUF2971 domain-containing protein, partial [Alphaproteobacteria bacterium]
MNIHLLEMLTNAEFYMATKENLNEPLDSTYTISLENYLNIYHEKYPSLKDDKESIERSTRVFNWWMEDGKNDWINNIDELHSKLRVCCFTEEANHPLMWSHYAFNHTGVCLTFEPSKDSVLEKSLYPVTYTDELLEAKSISDLRKCLLSKLNAWKIEKEWRIISENDKFRFKQEALVEIVFGLKVSDSTMGWFKYFREGVYYMDTPIYKLKLKGNRLVKIDEYGEE